MNRKFSHGKLLCKQTRKCFFQSVVLFVSFLFLSGFEASAQKSYYLRGSSGEPFLKTGFLSNLDAMSAAYGPNGWTTGDFTQANPATVFSQLTCFVYLDGSDLGADELNTFLTRNSKIIEDWVCQGGHLFLNASPSTGGNIYLGFDGTTLVYPILQYDAKANTSHVIFNTPNTTGTNWKAKQGSYFSSAAITGTGLVSLIKTNGDYTVLAEKKWGSGRVIFGGLSISDLHSPQPEGNFLRINIIDYLSRCSMRAFNDAGIAEIVKPEKFCSGNNEVRVKILNNGLNNLDSFMVNWSINGRQQNSIPVKGLLHAFGTSKDNDTFISLGHYAFQDKVKTEIRVWTSYPNGVQDTMNDNDTLAAILQPALKGSYIIGSNGDYKNPAQAADELHILGICGPVVFHIDSGTYTGSVSFKNIPGISPANPIIFAGAGKDNTIITHEGTALNNWSTVSLEGADHITFRDLTIAATGKQFAVAVLLTNNADHNNFINLNIGLDTTYTRNASYGILVSASTVSNAHGIATGNYNRFDSLYITGGWNGIVINGKEAAPNGYCTGNRITNSIFIQQYSFGILAEYANRITITKNKIQHMLGGFGYGMYLNYINPTDIANNILQGRSRGLHLSNINTFNYEGKRSRIYNNMISASYNIQAAYFNECFYLDLYHNSIAGPVQGRSLTEFVGCGGLNVRNNIFANLSAGYAVSITNTGFLKLDHNAYYTKGNLLISHNNLEFDSLASWKQTFPQFNQYSINGRPAFIKANDLHLSQDTSPFCAENVGISEDIDGDIRCAIGPGIGADEISFTYPLPLVSMQQPDTVFEASLATIKQVSAPAYGERIVTQWYVNDVYVTEAKELEYIFSSAGNYKITLEAENCSGDTSITENVMVLNATRAPETDFTLSGKYVNLFDLVYLQDISAHGASNWLWNITPNDGFTMDDENIPNPELIFYTAGTYEVCLTTGNSKGRGKTICKEIHVRDEHEFCDGTASSDNITGRLTDDGGIFQVYGPNRHCNFQINTQGHVQLTFKYFSLADSLDELRIYDGDSTEKTLLGRYNGKNTSLPGGTSGFIAYSGKMFIEWITNDKNQGNGFEAYWNTIADTLKPVITLYGKNPDTAAISEVYKDPGARATDYINLDLTPSLIRTDLVNTQKTGKFFIHYAVTDKAGNKDSATREVHVVDTTKPEIILIDGDTVYLQIGQPYQEPGYALQDNFYAPETIFHSMDSSELNTRKPGVYKIRYTAIDGSNNSTVAIRWVIVRDLISPEISLIGADTIYVDVNSIYVDPGVKVYDNYCADTSWQTDMLPDMRTLGEYVLTYAARDCEGNSAPAIKRVIKVVDRKAPVIRLKDEKEVTLEEGEHYTDAGYTITDNYYDESELIPLVQTTSNINTRYAGEYSICYQVTDPSGNISDSICRKVNIIKKTSGLTDVDSESLIIYPNPCQGKFSIKRNDIIKGHFQIIDLAGRIVKTISAEVDQKVMEADVSDLPAGTYIIRETYGEYKNLKLVITDH